MAATGLLKKATKRKEGKEGERIGVTGKPENEGEEAGAIKVGKKLTQTRQQPTHQAVG